jgi:hypothetical protein
MGAAGGSAGSLCESAGAQVQKMTAGGGSTGGSALTGEHSKESLQARPGSGSRTAQGLVVRPGIASPTLAGSTSPAAPAAATARAAAAARASPRGLAPKQARPPGLEAPPTALAHAPSGGCGPRRAVAVLRSMASDAGRGAPK